MFAVNHDGKLIDPDDKAFYVQIGEAGVYNCYLLPVNWVAPTAANGKMPMSDVFNCIYNTTYSWNWATNEELAAAYGSDWAKKDATGAYVKKVPATSFKYGIDYWFKNLSGKTFSFDKAIQGISERDSKYNAILWNTYSANGSDKSLKFVEGHVVTVAGDKVDEYFTVAEVADGKLYFKATQTSENTNPTANVPSRVKLTYLDMYGHPIVIKLDVTIEKR